MKKIALCCFAVLFFALSACASGSAAMRGSRATVSELVDKATENLLWDNVIYTSDAGEGNQPLDEIYFRHYYGAKSTEEFWNVIGSYCVAVQTQNSADEIGVFKVNTAFDEDAFRAEHSDLSGDALTRAIETQKQAMVEKNIAAAREFCDNRINIFLAQTENYDKNEYAKAQNALVANHGYYVYYIISGDNTGIEKVIKAQIDAKAA